jgi:predicted metalloprotease with PDZ domain
LKTSTSEWQIVAPTGCVVVTYDIHLDAHGPFGSQVSADGAFLNWAMVLMYSPALRKKPVVVRFESIPANWKIRDLGLCRGFSKAGEAEKKPDEQIGAVFIACSATSYDELVDSPVAMGTLQESSFQQDGATYHVVVDASPDDYDMAKLDEVLARITHAAVDWMQDRPYEEYTFLYHFPRGPGAGGMEHAYGTAIEISAERLRESLLPVADVSAHEFFHLWNVKRIRPQSLEPVDYQHDQDTRALWFSEGVTSTVGEMLLVRGGLVDEQTYLQRLSAQITELQRRPARRWQSAEESGLDAWFEGNAFYRSPERSISYYNKGDILGTLLDLRIRRVTDGHKSLRDLFQWMNAHYARQHRFFDGSAAVQQAADAVTGQSFADFFRDYVAGTEELPYDELLQFAGLRVVNRMSQFGTAGFTTTANIGGQTEVLRVEPKSEAQRAGILPGDRILELNGGAADHYFDVVIAQMRPGTAVRLKIENRRGVREVNLRLGTRSDLVYEVQDLAEVTAEQHAHRAAWIHGEDETRGTP